MPQEHNVLRCYSCNTFQVHIVKKSKKWECKMCGAKQSLKRNYGKGSGKDCRAQVMKLNELQILNQTNLIQQHEQLCDSDIENDSKQQQDVPEEKKTSSKWIQFIDENELEDEEDSVEEYTNTSSENVNKKRKISHEDIKISKHTIGPLKQSRLPAEWRTTSDSLDKKNIASDFNKASNLNTPCNFELFDSTIEIEMSRKRKFDEYENEPEIKKGINATENVRIYSNIFDSDPNNLDEIINMSF